MIALLISITRAKIFEFFYLIAKNTNNCVMFERLGSINLYPWAYTSIALIYDSFGSARHQFCFSIIYSTLLKTEARWKIFFDKRWWEWQCSFWCEASTSRGAQIQIGSTPCIFIDVFIVLPKDSWWFIHASWWSFPLLHSRLSQRWLRQGWQYTLSKEDLRQYQRWTCLMPYRIHQVHQGVGKKPYCGRMPEGRKEKHTLNPINISQTRISRGLVILSAMTLEAILNAVTLPLLPKW